MFLRNLTGSNPNNALIKQNVDNAKKSMNTPEGQEYKNSCIQGLQMRDFNSDGVTTAREMGTDFNQLTQTIFGGANNSSSAEAFQLSAQAGSIFENYAGSDGVLDAYEYSAAINSDEYDDLITKYNKLQDELDNYDYEVDSDLNMQKENPAFDNINSLKASYINEILSERVKVTDYVINLENAGAWDFSKGDSDSYLIGATDTASEYIKQLADCVFEEAGPILSSETISKEEKDAKIAEIKAKMEEIKNQGKEAMKTLYSSEENTNNNKK